MANTLTFPPLHLLSSRSPRKVEAVFSLKVNNDGLRLPRVDLKWEYLPSESVGIAERELSLLAVGAMSSSNFSYSLNFMLAQNSVSALVPREASISGLEFSDFFFENPAVHASMHGKWTVASTESRQCGETRCTIGYIVTYKHDVSKLKVT